MGRIAEDFRQEMRKSLYESYLTILRSGDCETQYEAIERARRSTAPNFFTSSKNAAYVLNLMEKGLDHGLKNPDKVRKFLELKRIADEYKRSCKEYPGLLNVCREIVNEPAPEYYICYSTAKQMILEERRRRMEEMMRWVKRDK